MATPKKKKKAYYMGNSPNSPEYDPSLPINGNRWDEEEVLGDNEDLGEDESDWEDDTFGEDRFD